MMNDLSILVVSCDKNEWLVRNFFRFFRRYWVGCPFKVYLSMEESDISFENVTVLRDTEKRLWCGRVKNHLGVIDSKYVIIMLDDFLIEEDVNQKKLETYLRFAIKNDVYNLILTEVPNERNEIVNNHINSDFVKRHRYGRYKTSLQCGLWNRNVLSELLNDNESAWEFELFGNIRSFLYKNNLFYAITDKEKKPIKYNDGFFMVQGKLNGAEKRRIEDKCGIEIELDNGIDCFEGYIVRDNIKLMPRVIRRVKIMVMYTFYRILCIIGVKKD